MNLISIIFFLFLFFNKLGSVRYSLCFWWQLSFGSVDQFQGKTTARWKHEEKRGEKDEMRSKKNKKKIYKTKINVEKKWKKNEILRWDSKNVPGGRKGGPSVGFFLSDPQFFVAPMNVAAGLQLKVTHINGLSSTKLYGPMIWLNLSSQKTHVVILSLKEIKKE